MKNGSILRKEKGTDAGFSNGYISCRMQMYEFYKSGGGTQHYPACRVASYSLSGGALSGEALLVQRKEDPTYGSGAAASVGGDDDAARRTASEAGA